MKMFAQTSSVVVVAFLIVAAMSGGASADTVFFDDFNDGDAEDGHPVTWIPLTDVFPGTYDASSGDYFLEPAAPDSAAAAIVLEVLQGVSVRAQVRIPETSDENDNIAIIVRGDTTTLDAYLAGIGVDGDVVIGRPNTTVGCCIALVPTDLRPVEEEVVIQFDAFEDRLQLWAWRPGEPMPASPQIDVTDDVLSGGVVGLVYTSETDTPDTVSTPGNALVRYFHVADMHIPEPSTLFLFLCGLCAFGRFARASRS